MTRRVAQFIGDSKPIPDTHIREWRKFKGYTLDALAKEIGLTASTLSRIEKGEGMLTWVAINAIAQALGETSQAILYTSPHQPKNDTELDNFINELRALPPALRKLTMHVARSLMTHESIAPHSKPKEKQLFMERLR